MTSMQIVALALAAVAAVVMAVDLVAAVKLRRALARGEIGRKWSLLTALLAFFLLGYVVAPLSLLLGLSQETMSLLTFGVFLLGAAFVWIVIGILRDALSFLDLLKGD
ncbi:MAG: hypothetical protein IPJ17_15260 [Holophagales bacterium]|nr:MAG: hypothetical protein IPJ17_15260 [Holophagales bacterium]